MQDVSTSLTVAVQKTFENDRVFRQSRGIWVATRLLSHVLETAWTNPTSDQRKAKQIGGKAWRCFCSGYSEHDWVTKQVRHAKHAESTLILHENTFLHVDIRFYRKREEMSFATLSFDVEIESGAVSGGSRSD